MFGRREKKTVPQPDAPSPDPLKLPQDDLLGAMPFGDELAAEESPQPETPDALMAAADLGSVPGAAETAEEPAGGRKKKEKKKKEKKDKRKKDRKENAPAGVKTPGPPLLTKIARSSPYTVMLAIALGSLVIGVSVLVLYLSQYQFKIHP